ncbi:MAG TPA: flagellar biosynthesis protein FliQ [Candidatus Polarisedimenticolia bacterium]|nr:flagellar biosynthesis protein FliQ [Candidatus Polarisedimenticolia bacterium]
MNESAVIEIGRQALQVTLMAALPMLLASLVVGIVVSLVQVATSLQDATLTFVPKILAVGGSLVLAGHWIIRLLLEFTRHIFADLPGVIG